MPLLNGKKPLVKDAKYGYRIDGTPKGTGFLGELKRKDGGISTEISVGVDFGNGETQIPTIVPTLSEEELDFLLNKWDESQPIPEPIINKAIEHAIGRINKGMSPFYD